MSQPIRGRTPTPRGAPPILIPVRRPTVASMPVAIVRGRIPVRDVPLDLLVTRRGHPVEPRVGRARS